jgi:NAD+ diphosphatase
MMDWESLDVASMFEAGTSHDGESAPAFHIIISDDEILCPATGPWKPVTSDEFRWLSLESIGEHFLGYVSGVPVYATEVDSESEEPEGYAFDTLWSFLGQVDGAVFSLVGKAKQILEWFRTHRFCGQCGKPTGEAASDRSRKCESCNQMFYPRLSPSIIVLITRGEEVLLAKNANTRGNFYSTLAGFVEPGESLEQTVHREVFEEVGLKVKNLQYFNSQSWPFPNSLMLGFHAEYDSGEINIQEEEIADAQWFHYTEMPNRPAMVSISGWLIDEHIKKLQVG